MSANRIEWTTVRFWDASEGQHSIERKSLPWSCCTIWLLEFFFLQNTGKQPITIVSSSLLWNSDLQIWKEDAGSYLSKKLVSGFELWRDKSGTAWWHSEVKTVSFSNFLSVRDMKIKSCRSHPSLHIHTKLTPRNELKVYGKNKTDSWISCLTNKIQWKKNVNCHPEHWNTE